jgi:hypothetical protein
MKRDMELVRAILIAMEAHPTGYAPPDLSIPGYDETEVGYHVHLMHEGELVTAFEAAPFGAETPVAIPLTITWKGHEFLDAVRNDTVWAKVKTIVKERGSPLPFTVLQALALKYLAAHFGLTP